MVGVIKTSLANTKLRHATDIGVDNRACKCVKAPIKKNKIAPVAKSEQ